MSSIPRPVSKKPSPKTKPGPSMDIRPIANAAARKIQKHHGGKGK